MATLPRTHCIVSGSGPALVLIHGVGLDLTMWAPALPLLEKRFTVVRYDLLGHGATPAIGTTVTLDDFVEQLRDVLDRNGIQRAHVLGFSLGGIVCRGWAAAYPDRTDRLVVLCSIMPRTPEQRAAIAGRLRQLEEGGSNATLDAAIARWYTQPFIAARPDVIDWTRGVLLANAGPGYPAAYRFFATSDDVIAPLGAKIRAPMLAITAENDVGSTPEMSVRMAAEVQNARSHVVPTLRHMAVVESPEAVLAPVIAFLES